MRYIIRLLPIKVVAQWVKRSSATLGARDVHRPVVETIPCVLTTRHALNSARNASPIVPD